MNEALNEQLSALVDDELDGKELPLLMKQVDSSGELATQLERYYLIRDAMRRELPECGQVQLADRVSEALESESVHHARRGWRWSGHALRPAAGLAIAASVAVLAVSLWSTPPTTPQQQPPVLSNDNVVGLQPQAGGAMRVSGGDIDTGVTEPRQSEPVAAKRDGNREWKRLDPSVQHWLNSYIVDHSEFAGSAQLGGVINYARIASQEPAPKD